MASPGLKSKSRVGFEDVRGALRRLVSLVNTGEAAVFAPDLLPLLDLSATREPERAGADRLERLFDMLRGSVKTMGDSQDAALLTIVLGLEPHYRQLPAQERRRLAGRDFRGGHRPVSAGTIRQYHEPRAIDRLAALLAAPSAGGEAGRLDDPPERVSLLEMLELAEPTGERLAARWARHTGRDLRAVIGKGSDGPVAIDLMIDGPHVLVAGMTGAGKSELLRSLVASLAVAVPPDRVQFLLMDYKGGAALGELADLPHTAACMTDHREHDLHRVLVSLGAELRRRENLLSEAGAMHLEDLLDREPGRAPPNLVIVVDEFAALAREAPAFVEGLVDVAARGRSVGLRMIVATQRVGGVVDDRIRANVNMRIALRLTTADESEAAIAIPDAAELPAAIPGRALARRGSGRVEQFQVALGSGRATSDDAPPGRTELNLIAEAARTAKEVAGVCLPDAPWALPSRDIGTLRPAREARPRLERPKDRDKALQALSTLFEPARPITRTELFLGRADERARFLQAVSDAGRHAVIYGERGVGKTSLGLVMTAELADEGATAVRVSCSRADRFIDVWEAALVEVERARTGRAVPYTTGLAYTGFHAEASSAGSRPRDVVAALRRILDENPQVIFVFDEFDQLDVDERTLFASTMKLLSDEHVHATIVLIGVAETVDELMVSHGSLSRAVEQIQMPRMSRRELGSIIATGYAAVGLTIDRLARETIVRMSSGLPYYTHLLARDAAGVAIRTVSARVTRTHVDEAINRITKSIGRTMATAYQQATACSAESELCPQIILAAALAPTDAVGYFQPSDVSGALKQILGSSISLEEVRGHLDAMTQPDRGPALQRQQVSDYYRYRFREPMLQPYVIMSALRDGTLTRLMFDRLHGPP